MVTSEDHKTGGFGGEILSRLVEECFELLDAPPQRVCSIDTPIGFSRILEAEILIDDRKIYSAAVELMRY
jgi:2-oxoisovalerate dehydrogenase E1 component